MEQAHEYVCVLVTAPTLTLARKLANAALKDHLVACANLVPKVESHYWWQGQLESSSEVLILFKTRREALKELERCICKNHTYDTPEFIAFKIEDGNEKYLKWISGSLQLPEGSGQTA